MSDQPQLPEPASETAMPDTGPEVAGDGGADGMPPSKELQRAETDDVGAPSPMLPATLALIERVARDPNADVDKLERMLALQERLIAREAESEFNQAMERIARRLADVRIVRRKPVMYDQKDEKGNKTGRQGEAFRFAPLEDLDKILRPVLIEEGITLSDTTEILNEGVRIIVTRATHRSGHFRDARIPLPLDTTGGKSNVQGMGSTYSYGRRYNRVALFNLVTLDDDDGTGGYVDDAMLKHLRELIGKVQKSSPRSDEAAFCKLMKIDTLAELPFARYRAATSVLEERLTKTGDAA